MSSDNEKKWVRGLPDMQVDLAPGTEIYNGTTGELIGVIGEPGTGSRVRITTDGDVESDDELPGPIAALREWSRRQSQP
jgi:hypothetical protein